jgi:hypothetical protein
MIVCFLCIINFAVFLGLCSRLPCNSTERINLFLRFINFCEAKVVVHKQVGLFVLVFRIRGISFLRRNGTPHFVFVIVNMK